MWAAGFYEGEGSLSCSEHVLILSIGQVDPEPLWRFREVVGCGTITQSPKLSTFRCYGPVAQRVAMMLFPQLSGRRRRQILIALTRYASRKVRDPQRCRQRHLYSEVGEYTSPAGKRECAECRRLRRRGALPPAVLPTALEARVGVREYVPPVIRTAHEAVAWTFDMTEREYGETIAT